MTSIERLRLLGSFLAYQATKNVERYATAGRRFVGLDDHELDMAWIVAWRRTLLDPSPHPLNYDYEDLSAELQLRGRPSPKKLIGKEERRHLMARAAPLYARSALRIELDDQLHEFFEAWRRPRH